MDDLVALLKAIAALLQAVCWPTLALGVIYVLRKPLLEFFNNLGEFTVKTSASGVELRAKKAQAIANLAAASVKASSEHQIDPNKPIAVVSTIENYSNQQIFKLSGKKVLWVDDNPINNIYEKNALKALGIRVTTSLSTEDALKRIQADKFEVIISDLGRNGDKRAGFTLLEALNDLNNTTPFIIYSAQTTPQLREEALRKSAFAQTNVAEELFEMVLNALLLER